VTDLAIPEPQTDHVPAIQSASPAVPEPMSQAAALVEWANAARQAGLIAQSLANTSFVPATLRGKPADITAAILAGQELGLQPMATLRSMDVIQGTPALRAHAMRGLVQSRGHIVELVESSNTHCVMRGRRKDSDTWQQVEWDLPRATLLGLTGKSEWKKQPKTMLVARATGELCRLIASDVLYAMPYASEELTGSPIDSAVVVNTPRVTVAEITQQADNIDLATSDDASDDGWSAVEYPDVVEDESQVSGWPTVAQPGGAQ